MRVCAIFIFLTLPLPDEKTTIYCRKSRTWHCICINQVSLWCCPQLVSPTVRRPRQDTNCPEIIKTAHREVFAARLCLKKCTYELKSGKTNIPMSFICLLYLFYKLQYWLHGPFTRYVILRVAHAPGMPERFPRQWLQRKPLVSDPGMHHGTCVMHVPWCMSGSLTPQWRGKRSRHSRRMRNAQFHVSGKRSICRLMIHHYLLHKSAIY